MNVSLLVSTVTCEIHTNCDPLPHKLPLKNLVIHTISLGSRVLNHSGVVADLIPGVDHSLRQDREFLVGFPEVAVPEITGPEELLLLRHCHPKRGVHAGIVRRGIRVGRSLVMDVQGEDPADEGPEIIDRTPTIREEGAGRGKTQGEGGVVVRRAGKGNRTSWIDNTVPFEEFRE